MKRRSKRALLKQREGGEVLRRRYLPEAIDSRENDARLRALAVVLPREVGSPVYCDSDLEMLSVLSESQDIAKSVAMHAVKALGQLLDEEKPYTDTRVPRVRSGLLLEESDNRKRGKSHGASHPFVRKHSFSRVDLRRLKESSDGSSETEFLPKVQKVRRSKGSLLLPQLLPSKSHLRHQSCMNPDYKPASDHAVGRVIRYFDKSDGAQSAVLSRLETNKYSDLSSLY